MIAAADLNALLDDLDRLGLETGPAARQRAHLLFAGLAGSFPEDSEAAKQVLADHLKPLIVKRVEQALTYDRGVAAWTGQPPPPDPDQPHAADPVRPVRPKPRRKIPLRFLSAIAVIVLAVAILPWSLSGLRTGEEEPVVSDVGGTPNVSGPVPGAEPTSPDPRDTETAPAEAESFDGPDEPVRAEERVVFRLVIESMNSGMAPTLNELVNAAAITGISARELSDLTGIPEHQPIPISAAPLIRIIVGVLIQGTSDDSLERVFRDMSRERDVTELLLAGARTNDLDDFVGILRAPESQLANMGLTRDMLRFTEDSIRKNSEITQALDELIQPMLPTGRLDNTPGIVAADFIPGEGSIIVAVGNGLQMMSRDESSGDWAPFWAARLNDVVTELAVSPDGRTLVVAYEGSPPQYLTRLSDGGWSVPPFALADGAAVGMSFSGDSQRLAFLSSDVDVQVMTRTEAGRFDELVSLSHPNGVIRIALSRDGTRAATITGEGIAQVWTADEQGSWRNTFLTDSRGNAPFAADIAFAPDSDQLVTTGDGGALYSWTPAPDGTWRSRLVETYNSSLYAPAFSPDGRLLVVSTDRSEVHTLYRGNAGDLSRGSTLSMGDLVERVRFDPAGDEVMTSGPDNALSLWRQVPLPETEKPLKTAEFVSLLRERDALTDRVRIPETASDAQLARLGSALMYRAGSPVAISDAPWLGNETESQAGSAWISDNFASLVAGLLILLGVLAWLRQALSQRGYLQRRKPGDAGRVIELFSEARTQAERAQLAIRQAAKSLLGRQPGASRIDILGSVRATARSAGLFTPVEKRETRLPEYLFLIDSRSRSDHETQRALDYVERLRREHVPVRAFFFERAPDRIRQGDGMPSVPLDQIASEHSEKRLVLVGDAAAMITPDSVGDGHWIKALESWRSKAFVTTVSPDEWGPDEKAFAARTGLSANVLSARGLENLPRVLTGESDSRPGETNVTGSLDVPPLPMGLRRHPDRWVHGRDPGDAAYRELEAELIAYLGMPGFRWLCACAVYPLIEWELTVALGQVLKDSSGEPVYSESRAARLAELPWMRAGDMPDWLRGRLIDAIDPEDEQEVKALIARILSAVETSGPVGEDAIRLKFGHLRGRQADDDEQFVSFVTKSPETADRRVLEATRKLRSLLRPSVASRFANLRGLAWLLGSAVFAGLALLLAPDTGPARSGVAAWFPLALLILIPLAGWLVMRFGSWLVHYLAEFARNLFADIRGIPGAAGVWFRTLTGLGLDLAESSDLKARRRAITIMRNRLETWTTLFLFWPVLIAVLFAYFASLELWQIAARQMNGPLTALRQQVAGDMLLTVLAAALLATVIVISWHLVRLVHRVTVWITDMAARRHPDLSGQAPDPVLRSLSVAGAGFVILVLDVIANQTGLSGALSRTAGIADGSEGAVINPVFGSILVFQLVVGVIVGHHWLTLRRFANRLMARRAREPVSDPGKVDTTPPFPEAGIEETGSMAAQSQSMARQSKVSESVA